VSDFAPFSLTVGDDGVGTVVFDRPPVNAFSLAVYEALGHLVDAVRASEDVRVLVLAAPDSARAWCGGADLKDFVDMDPTRRKQRYAFINAVLPRFAELDRPVVAAVNGHAVGIGVVLAGLCDLRIAANTATFACPEVDYGLVGGGAGLFSYLNMPEALIREMLYTGRRFSAEEMRQGGFLNRVVERHEVMEASLTMARTIAAKSLPSLRARKRVSVAIEGMSWNDSYLLAQAASADLVAGDDAGEGVLAFLQHRRANFVDG
jgi:enoyl-CoA hydratase